MPSIHGDARARCLALVREARDAGRTSLQVVTGGPGEGKTHLIAWLRRQSEEGSRKGTATGRFALTVVPPLRSLASARHHVLQEVVRQLSVRLSTMHVDEATDTPIEILLWRALLAIAKILVADKSTPAELRTRLEDATLENPDKHLSACVMTLQHAWPLIERAFVDAALRLPALAAADRDVFRVLAQFPRGDEAERTAIVDWLGGASLSADRLEALGSSLVLDEEAEAGRGLKTLLVFAHLAATPVALAFDQIEGTQRLGPDALTVFLDTVADLYNDCPSTVILLFCQTQILPILREQATDHARDRLDDAPALHLRRSRRTRPSSSSRRGCGTSGKAPPRGRRICFFRSVERGSSEIERGQLRTARAVVRHFHSLLREPAAQRDAFVPPAPPPPDEVIRRKLDSLVEEEARTARPPDARAEVTQSVVFDLFHQADLAKRQIGAATIREVERHRARKTSLEGIRFVVGRGDQTKRVYLESSNREHGKSTASTVKHFADVLEAKQADVTVLLREDAFALPPATKKALVELGPRSVVLRLSEGEIAPLAAIESLLNAAAAGDVPANRKTALDIAVEHLEAKLPIAARIVAAVLPAVAAPVVLQVPSVKRPSVDEQPPMSRDPVLVEQRTSKILDHLRTKRPFEPVAQLATALGLTVEVVHADLQALAARGDIELLSDRNRAAVVLLRPEVLSR